MNWKWLVCPSIFFPSATLFVVFVYYAVEQGGVSWETRALILGAALSACGMCFALFMDAVLGLEERPIQESGNRRRRHGRRNHHPENDLERAMLNSLDYHENNNDAHDHNNDSPYVVHLVQPRDPRVDTVMLRAAAVDCPKEVECAICLDVWTDPIQLIPCGHVYCKKCVSKLDKCPQCRTDIRSHKFPQSRIRREAGDVLVECPACGWQGTKRQAEDHKKHCVAG